MVNLMVHYKALKICCADFNLLITNAFEAENLSSFIHNVQNSNKCHFGLLYHFLVIFLNFIAILSVLELRLVAIIPFLRHFSMMFPVRDTTLLHPDVDP